MGKSDEDADDRSGTDDSTRESSAERTARLVVSRRLSSPSREVWFKRYWRPAMAWTYMVLIVFDFILAPMATMALSAYRSEVEYKQWRPLSLEGGGLVHLALGSILGVYAWGRTKEKTTGAAD